MVDNYTIYLHCALISLLTMGVKYTTKTTITVTGSTARVEVHYEYGNQDRAVAARFQK